MAIPRAGLNATTHSVGFTAKLVTVQSVTKDGTTAITVDRQRTETRVPMLVQRSKAALPAPGETWLLTQDLGVWTFAAFVGAAPANFQGGSAGTERLVISALAPASPAAKDIWINESSGQIFQWNGTAWTAVQLSGGLIIDGSIPASKLVSGSITSAQIAPDAGITAGQVAFSTQDIGGVQFFRGPQPPANPQPGDFWYDTLAGNVLSVWDGNAWEQILLGAQAIQPGSLTADQLSAAAGIGPNQVSFTFRDIGGMTVFFQAAQPASPLTGDLWYDQSNGYALRQWDGTQWVPYQFSTGAIAARSITAELIAAGTITAQHLAAGIIYAGIIDGTEVNAAVFTGSTFQGLDFIINNKGEFYYSGTPALGNLAVSITPPSGPGGRDDQGNTYLPGVVTYDAVGPGTVMAAIQQTGLNITAYTVPSPGGTYTAVQGQFYVVNTGLGIYQLALGGTAGATVAIDSPLATVLNITEPGTSTAETWHTATLLNSWAGSGAGVNGLKYRQNVLHEVEIQADLTSPGTASVIATLPFGYRPVSDINIPVFRYDDSGIGHAVVDSSGDITMQTTIGSGHGLFINAKVPLGL